MSLDNPEIALKNGSTLNEYTIVDILGIGGFGITYLAIDSNLDKKVVIKEFLPEEIATRDSSNTVRPKSSSNLDDFEWAKNNFLQEAKTLARFNHPNIVKINRFFEANSTAYFVMDFEEGEDLEAYLLRGYVNEEELTQIVIPILDALREVHAHKFLHRDIKPSNIFIRKNGTPMLIDFGSSRYAINSKTKNMTKMFTPGYTPIEQYSSDASKQGVATDIYSMGAVMYKMLTAKMPVESQDRINAVVDDEPDPYVKVQKESHLDYSQAIYESIDKALNLRYKDRPQSIQAFQKMLLKDSTPKPKELVKPKKSKKLMLIASYLFTILATFLFFEYIVFNDDDEQEITREVVVQQERKKSNELLKEAIQLDMFDGKEEEAYKYLYEQSAELGNVIAKATITIREYFEFQEKKDNAGVKRAKQTLMRYNNELKKLAKEGNLNAQLTYGVMANIYGETKTAYYWLEKASSRGYAPAQYAYANIAHKILGDEETLSLITKASNQGLYQAKVIIGKISNRKEQKEEDRVQ